MALSSLPLLMAFFGVELFLDFRMWNGDKPFHKGFEFIVFTLSVLGGRFWVSRHNRFPLHSQMGVWRGGVEKSRNA
jgi:hypothetical protein